MEIALELRETAVRRGQMGVLKARKHRLPAERQDAGPGTHESLDLTGRADGGDPALANGERLDAGAACEREVGVRH